MIPKIQIKEKTFFRNLKSYKIGMPKKMMPKSQIKNKTLFPQYPFLTLKRYHANKYAILSF